MKNKKNTAMFLMGCFVFTTLMTGQTIKTIEKELQTDSDTKIFIQTKSADVFIEESKSETIELIAELSVKTNNAKRAEKMFKRISVEMGKDENGNVVISVSEKTKEKPFFGLNLQNSSVKLMVGIPSDREVDISVASSDLSISEVKGVYSIKSASGDSKIEQFYGSLKVSTASGDIRLLELEGPMDVRTSSGDVFGENLNGSLVFKTVSGDVIISNGQFSRVEGDSVSGDLKFSLDSLPTDSVILQAMSGDIDLMFNTVPNAQIKMTSLSGDLEMNLPEGKNMQHSKNQITTTFGQGLNLVEAKTHSGDIFVGTK